MLLPFIASLEEERSSPSSGNVNGPGSNGSSEKEPLTPKQRHQMKHRELFLSRQVETLPATHIRGKCSVTLLNETESMLSYLNKDVSSMKIIESNIISRNTNVFDLMFSVYIFYFLFYFLLSSILDKFFLTNRNENVFFSVSFKSN